MSKSVLTAERFVIAWIDGELVGGVCGESMINPNVAFRCPYCKKPIVLAKLKDKENENQNLKTRNK